MDPKKRIKAVAYARCSKLLNQDPTTQLVHIREYCLKQGYDLVEEYVDFGISGSQEKRPALDKLLDEVKRRKFDIVITAALDRISRSTKHFLQIFEELNLNHISLVSLRENLDFASPVGAMVATVLSSIATLEKSIIAERIKNSLAAKRILAVETQSGWRCGRPSLPKDTQDEIRKLRATGMSLRQIAKATGVGKTTISRLLGGPKPLKKMRENHE